MATSDSEIIRKFHSDLLETQLSACDEARRSILEFVHEAAELLFRSSSRYVIAEKLLAIGPAVIPELNNRLKIEGNPEAKIHSALILLKLGSQTGLSQLVEALRIGIGPTGMITEALATAGAKSAIGAITDALMRWPVDKDPYTAVTMIYALRKLDASVPDEVLRSVNSAAPKIGKLL
jgi:hypothetical protein